MADFQSVAAESTSKLTALLEEVAQTQGQLQTAKTELSDTRQQIDDAWTGLNEQVQSLVETINASKTELATEAEAVEQSIAQLKQKIDTVQQELLQDLEETKGAIAALDDQLTELNPELDGDLQSTEDAFTTLQDQDIGTELEQTITQTVQDLQTVNTDLQGFQTELNQQVETLASYLSDQVTPAIATSVEGLGGHLDGIIDHFNQQIQDMGDGVKQSMQDLLVQVQQGQDGTFSQLETNVHTLEEVMGKLSTAVETASASVVEGGRTLADGVELTTESCKTSVQLLSDANAALEKF